MSKQFIAQAIVLFLGVSSIYGRNHMTVNGMKTISSHISKAVWLLTCLLFIPVANVWSQTDPQGLTPEMLLPKFTNLSPEAASLGKFGAYSVSEYTGSPDIRIPLFTIQSGDVSIPVELYYDASGIKVDQDATFVGLGWNLSYGGCINHIVCGEDDYMEQYWYSLPDDYIKNYLTRKSASYYPYENDMVEVGITGDISLCLPNKDREGYYLHEGMSKGCYMPDVFEASFCGQHVSFIIDKRDSYKIIILNNDPKKYKIEYVGGTSYAHYPSTIKITDDKGITYQFEGFTEFDFPDSYYLTKVYGPDGPLGKSAISYEYESIHCFRGISASRISFNYSTSVAKYKEGNLTEGIKFDIEPYLPSVLSQKSNTTYTENVPSFKIYPNKIITATETIKFSRTYNEREDLKGTYAINGIQVTSKGGTKLDTISFAYGYFEEDPSSSNSSNYTRKRLKLKSVMVNSKKYQMTYNDSILPVYGSRSKDYWGYYNGADNGLDMCGTPKYVVENNTTKLVEYLGNANRYASENLCKKGMLSRITYPTGGYTNFEFEANHFDNEFYYPDANQGQTSTINLMAEAVAIYGPQTKTETFSLNQKTKCRFGAYLITSASTKSVSTAILKNRSTGKVIKEFTISDGNILNEICDVTLAEGDYIIEANASAESNGYGVIAHCEVSYTGFSVPNPNVSLGESKGGISMGGGLRVKNVKNYDSDGSFLNGTEYEYRGGKLLKPTVKIGYLHLDFDYVKNLIAGHNYIYPLDNTDRTTEFPCLTYLYAYSEPSYLYACSVNVPAYVGYSKVIKKEIDASSKVVRKTELEYYNYEYQTDKWLDRLSMNFMYDCPNGYMNGKLKKETICSGDGTLQYMADYYYGDKELESVFYPKCVPLFLHGMFTIHVKYDVVLYRKNPMWCYLMRKNETFYDISGSKTTSRTTSLTYDSSNYQPSEQTVSDGTNSQKVKYWYPSTSGNQSTGLSYLIDKNCLSEVTGIDQYRNNKFTGGSRYDYTTKSSLPNNMPVVSKCHLILPDNSKVLQMTVTDNDSCGNIREYMLKDGTPVTIIWSYYRQHPVLEIVGSTYANVKAKVSAVTSLESSSSISYSTLKSVYTSLKTGLPDAHVTAYLYSPWHSVSRIIAPNGYETTYNYDNEGRLIEARDPQGILQKYQYNYKIK